MVVWLSAVMFYIFLVCNPITRVPVAEVKMEMEMEMVVIEALSTVEERSNSRPGVCETDLRSAVCVALGMRKPPLSPSSFFESILDMAFARFMPKQMEVEMGESFLAAVDARELEMMMVMIKPIDMHRKRYKTDFMSLDMETEMVLLQHMDV